MVAAQAAGRLGDRTFLSEADLDILKVALTLAGLHLGGIDTAMRRAIVQLGAGNLHILFDHMMETEIFIDVGGSHLTGGNGADSGGRAGDAVAAGEHVLHVAHLTAQLGNHSTAALDGNTCLLKAGDLDALTDGHHDDVGRNADFIQLCIVGAGTTGLIHLTDDLRLHPQGAGNALFIGLNADRCCQRHDLGTLGDGAQHLIGQGGHIIGTAAIGAGDLLSAQTDGAAGHVHGHVAAADDGYVLAGEIGHLIVTDGTQHLHGGHDVLAVLAGNARLFIGMGTDGDVNAVKLVTELVEGNVRTYVHVGIGFNTHREDGLNFCIQLLTGEAVGGDAVAQHTAQFLVLFKDGGLMTHAGQIVGTAEAAGAAADNGHLLTRGGSAGRMGHNAGIIHSETLNAADVQRIVDHAAAAAGFAGMLADVSASHRHGIILTNEADSVSITASMHQGHIAGNIHTGGAHGHTGNRCLQGGKAAMVLHMLLIVITEALQAVYHQTGGITTDGTVSGVDDAAGGFFNDVDGLHGSLTIQHLGDQLRQLTQADTAGYALTTGLGMAQLQKAQRHVHRTQARRRGGNTALHIFIEVFHRRLRLAGRLNIKSAQGGYLLSSCLQLEKPILSHFIKLLMLKILWHNHHVKSTQKTVFLS